MKQKVFLFSRFEYNILENGNLLHTINLCKTLTSPSLVLSIIWICFYFTSYRNIIK